LGVGGGGGANGYQPLLSRMPSHPELEQKNKHAKQKKVVHLSEAGANFGNHHGTEFRSLKGRNTQAVSYIFFGTPLLRRKSAKG